MAASDRNWRKGFFRLWLAGSLLWVVYSAPYHFNSWLHSPIYTLNDQANQQDCEHPGPWTRYFIADWQKYEGSLAAELTLDQQKAIAIANARMRMAQAGGKMSTYSISGPDGQTYSIDGPEGASREQIIDAIKFRMANPAPELRPLPPGLTLTQVPPIGSQSDAAVVAHKPTLGDLQALREKVRREENINPAVSADDVKETCVSAMPLIRREFHLKTLMAILEIVKPPAAILFAYFVIFWVVRGFRSQPF